MRTRYKKERVVVLESPPKSYILNQVWVWQLGQNVFNSLHKATLHSNNMMVAKLAPRLDL
jgi:hypothetical protein